MATQNLGVVVPIEAAADLSASQFHFMTIDSSSQIDETAAGLAADGVLQDKPAAAGRGSALALPGCFTKIKLGATLTAGDEVASDSTGRAVSTSSNDRILGRIKEGGAINELVTLHFYIGPIEP